MSWRKLLMVFVCCAFAFGGTFTCTSSSDSDDFTQNPQTPAKKSQ
jgi:hypothetical protein